MDLIKRLMLPSLPFINETLHLHLHLLVNVVRFISQWLIEILN